MLDVFLSPSENDHQDTEGEHRLQYKPDRVSNFTPPHSKLRKNGFGNTLPGIFDVEFVSSQLRNSGMLEAVQLMKDGYPIRIPFKEFVNRYGHLVEKVISFPDDRECCAAVLNKTFGGSSSLYQIGISKVFLKEQGRVVLRKKWEELQSFAALTLQKNLRGFLNRKNFQVYRRKITVVQAHVRGRQARRRYRRLKYNRVQFGAVLLISRISSIHRRICQVSQAVILYLQGTPPIFLVRHSPAI
ncbi:unconventional myosin-XV-like [Rana temporaria]|uniref:unconventional myosin-XV-like n=1 Tax=Rana temporaria TaxID=8407 RepID=UPI001AAC57EA|nr:unconventional myosin-XV-like [Rana temporaria]